MGGVVSGVLGVAGAFQSHSAAKKNARASREQAQQRARSAVQSMNFNLMNLREQRRDMFTAAMDELERVRLNSRGLEATVNASVGEELGEGRTARAINRATTAIGQRASSSIKANYEQQSNQIDLNSEQELIQARDFVSGIRAKQMPSRANLLLGVGSAALQGYSDYETVKAFQAANGLSDNKSATNAFWIGKVASNLRKGGL